jgi:hypothetical protein
MRMMNTMSWATTLASMALAGSLVVGVVVLVVLVGCLCWLLLFLVVLLLFASPLMPNHYLDLRGRVPSRRPRNLIGDKSYWN